MAQGASKTLLILAGGASVAAIAWGIWRSTQVPLAVVLSTRAVVATTAVATSAPASKPVPPSDFIGVVRDAYPEFPATEPLAIPAELREGARLILREPIYLDSLGDLWITRADAPATTKIFKTAADDQVHLTRERVLFVHHVLDDAGQWQPQIVCGDPDGNFVLISADGRLNLGKRFAYRWDRACEWNSTANEGFIVPTDRGVSIFRPRSLPVEMHYDFFGSSPGPTSEPSTGPGGGPSSQPEPSTQPIGDPQFLLDMRGLLAWIPWDETHTGSAGAARFVDGKWQPLGPDQGWPRKLLHLVPLIGGGVLQLVINDDGTVSETRAQMDAEAVDSKGVIPLIDQLSDPDPKVREGASAELTRYGPGLWPILEKTMDDQPPEGQMRIRRLLAAKENPALGRMTLLPGKVRVLSRLEDGGVLLAADGGVSTPASDPALPPIVTSPAHISIRPDRPIDLAPAPLVQDLSPDAHFDIAPDEWLVTDGSHGPQRLLGNHVEAMLHKTERQFSQFVGIDRKGRWLFRQPNQAMPTLILDPSLPDVTPRLPAWVDPVSSEVVGWDDAGWPVVMRNDNAWALHAEEWSPLPPPGPQRKLYKSLDEMPASTVATKPATTLASTTQAASMPMLIFHDSDGSDYFDGQNMLELHRPDGSVVRWPLPPEAVGTGEVHLLRAGDDRLFLFNQPGRVLRFVATPNGPEPFKLEATFARQIPNTDHFTRVWLDPAGRIDLEYDASHLTILFPDGRIPRAISEKMPAAQLKDDEQ
jgi:hypothetical protein